MQNQINNKRQYRFVIQDILLLHLKHVQHLTYPDYPELTLKEIIQLNDLYSERQNYSEFLNDGDKYKLDIEEILKKYSKSNKI